MPSDLPRLVTRVPENINNKFLSICKLEDRTASNMLGKIVKEYVEKYEFDHPNLTIEEDGTVIPKNDRTNDKPGKSSIFKVG